MPTNQQTDTSGSKIFAALITFLPIIAHVVNYFLGHEQTGSDAMWALSGPALFGSIYCSYKAISGASEGGADGWVFIVGTIAGLAGIIIPFAFYSATIN